VTASLLTTLLAAIRKGDPIAMVTVVDGPGAGAKALITPSDALGSLGDDALDRAVFGDARAMLVHGSTGTRRKRFPEADEVVVRWPHEFLAEAPVDERTALCVLTHDPKFDIPLLMAAVKTRAGYVGAMGSRRTHADRIRRLEEEGVGTDELGRIRGPIGLDIGARTPEEVAVAIAAEIIALQYGKPALALTDRAGPVHDDPAPMRPIESGVATA
jgi:xanthine/CO dehydrogenase XdhC/CoxF family maturation factor